MSSPPLSSNVASSTLPGRSSRTIGSVSKARNVVHRAALASSVSSDRLIDDTSKFRCKRLLHKGTEKIERIVGAAAALSASGGSHNDDGRQAKPSKTSTPPPMNDEGSIDDMDGIIKSIDGRLSKAMDHDEAGRNREATSAYMAAAEGYLNWLKRFENSLGKGGEPKLGTETCKGSQSTKRSWIVNKIKGRLEKIYDRVEQLKTSLNEENTAVCCNDDGDGDGGLNQHMYFSAEQGLASHPSDKDSDGADYSNNISPCMAGERPWYLLPPRDPSFQTVSQYYTNMLHRLRDAVSQSLPSIALIFKNEFIDACEREMKAKVIVDNAKRALERANKDGDEEMKTSTAEALKAAEACYKSVSQDTVDAAGPVLAIIEEYFSSNTTKCGNGCGPGTGFALDDNLVPCALLAQGMAGGELSRFSEQGSSEEALVYELLQKKTLMKELLQSGGARKGRYGRAYQIYRSILASSERAARVGGGDNVFRRLALGTCLEHAEPIPEFDTPHIFVDPVKRYLHYEQAYLDRELDMAFPSLSSWELRYVTNSDAPDEQLAWGRLMLRNYRPDYILTPDHHWRYANVVRSEVRYKRPEWLESPRSYPQMISGGGMCGPRAWFGRFITKCFGIPTWGVRQPGHAAMSRWTPGESGWMICLGGGMHKSFWEDKRGPDFVLEARARKHTQEFENVVLPLQWISFALGEKKMVDYCCPAASTCFWGCLAIMKMRILASIESSRLPPEPVNHRQEKNCKSAPLSWAEEIKRARDEAMDEDKEVIVTKDGIINVPAFSRTRPTADNRLMFTLSFVGGMQLHLTRDGTIEYEIDPPKSGKYAVSLQVVTVHRDQSPLVLTVKNKNTATESTVKIEIPYTCGRWEYTTPVNIILTKGVCLLRFGPREVPNLGLTFKRVILTPVQLTA